MNITNKFTELLLWIYKSSNKIGLFNSPIIQSIYITTYFKYKKLLEDSYYRLTQSHPNLFKNGHIIDVGANIGYTAYVFSKVLSDSYKIFAFEPERKNVNTLKWTSERFGFIENLITVAAAVGNNDGFTELWKNENHNGDHRILTEALKNNIPDNPHIQQVPIVSLDNYFKKIHNNSPISFIKIDVQGYEFAVCQGMTEILMNNANVVVGIEYCPSIIRALGFNPISLLQFFQDKNFLFYHLNKKNQLETFCPSKIDSLLQKKHHNYIDILCSKQKL